MKFDRIDEPHYSWPLVEESSRQGDSLLGPHYQTLAKRNRRLSQANARLVDINRSLRRELESAARIQRSLLPQRQADFEGVRFDWLFQPSSFAAGDTFNFFPLSEHELAFYVLDVAGHGLSAALTSIWLSRMLSPHVPNARQVPVGAGHPFDIPLHDPVQTVSKLNQCFQSEGEWAPYFTLLYCVLDTRTRELTMVQAGHPSPVLMRQGRASLLGEGGFAIGLLPEAEFTPLKVQIEPGDRLFMYSDGIVECRNQSEEPYSSERLVSLLEAENDQPLEVATQRLWTDLCRWHAEEEFEDDASLLAVEIL
ncbi:MAG TPA: PP2C family protein-serine/threonine phosphatase [Polyangia bacterium]|jgi:sigma-B regulation protein RsbU (phosphoserine phosphatase)|nr:PP2C family protein-serine/threonine phosphatase [Polyangia bacterium]